MLYSKLMKAQVFGGSRGPLKKISFKICLFKAMRGAALFFACLVAAMTVTNILCFSTARAADKAISTSVQKILDEENQARAKLDDTLISALKDMEILSATENSPDLLDAALLRAET